MDKNDKNEDKQIKKQVAVNETDTAPDEFIAPNADTDIPEDGEINNDAVLRGEPSKDDRLPLDGDTDMQQEEPPKMNAEPDKD